MHLAPLYIIVLIDLLLEFVVKQILHLPLSIDYVLRDFLVFFWTKVRLRGLLDILFIYLTAHLVHCDLLVQDLANRMLLLLLLHADCHRKAIVLFFESL